LLGTHNVRNTLAAVAVGRTLGIPVNTLVEGLRRFRGVKRRLEIVGRVNGVTVYDDFAHHPTAVAETIAAVRAGHPGQRVWAVFEPRSASSCRRIFQNEFARAFKRADQTVIARVFRSNLPEDQRLSVDQLVADVERGGTRARHFDGVEGIIETIVREQQPGDVVLIMSNGGFDGIHRKLVEALQRARAERMLSDATPATE
jgi:UDP-N-acetylmuramate: L-alanyl-gamma-D-glutamyl-meso-diaminopimelate ligase